MDDIDSKVSGKNNLEIINALNMADSIVYKTYLNNLGNMDVLQCPNEINKLELNKIAHFFKVDRFVSEKNENNRDKLVSVFNAVASCGGSVIVLIHSDGKKINYYFGAKALNNDILDESEKAFIKTLKGNFPGTEIVDVSEKDELKKITDNVFTNKKFPNQKKQICTITGIAGLRSEEESQEKLFIQGIEKLVDSMKGEEYSLLLIADPVSQNQIDIVKNGFESFYSQVFPFTNTELTYGVNENESISNSITKGLSKAVGKSVTDSLTHTKGSFKSHTQSKSNSFNFGISFILSAGFSKTWGDSWTSGTNESIAKGKATTDTEMETSLEQESKTDQKSKGTSKNLQLKFESKAIKNLLEKIELQLKRLDTSRDIGMWNCSVYCLSNDSTVCKIAASAYQSILRGENSSIEAGTITEWSKEKATAILPYLERMHHPFLKMTDDTEITPTSLISTSELTIHAGIPQTSVSGLPVLEMAAFGREITTHWENRKKYSANNTIYLGDIYHMGNKEELTVCFDKNNLAYHTFITGSTGSGKSNVIYQILSEIKKESKFLVIESAKGEYKKVFGKDVDVYGTNPELTPLLRLNPFSFPNGNKKPEQNIHILEHLDRLVGIFNACWPMYAAMPEVLKDAIECSYEQAGWDLQSSKCLVNPVKYPTFADVTVNIRKIIDSSEYSDENKGNYKGALITRLKSLTNGINGLIFTNDELGDKKLFDENVIIDISRAGSPETKSLIMGILILKLHEYRQTSDKMNADLQHITVLEEAHNLLKRTSTEQTSETANLLGKSVEMIANAIAEMRTYGEGFIIADQSPGLLDLSVIRNTNTKIILGLPDENDRILVGRATGLNDDQIVELAKLQIGVAAVYHNNWIQPVLCKVKEYIYDKKYEYNKQDTAIIKKINQLSELKQIALNNVKIDSVKLKEKIEAVDIDSFKALEPKMIASLFRNNEEVFNKAINDEQVKKSPRQGLYEHLIKNIEPSLKNINSLYRSHILMCIVNENCKLNSNLRDVPDGWELYVKKIEGHHV
jgi:hypothetical protein